MARVLLIALGMAVVMMGLGGCGHKEPPYYEKSTPKEGTNVAL